MKFFTPYLLLGIALSSLTALASPPTWVNQGQAADNRYKYYIGRSAEAANDSQAMVEATRDASEQAIRENFGVMTRIQSDSYETTTSAISLRRAVEKSDDVRLHGFEQVTFYRETRNEKVSLWVLFRYPIAEIVAEKARLLSRRGPQTEIDFSESGDDAGVAVRGMVEAVTFPSGATVLIDGESMGRTPLRLKGVVSAGKHEIRLDHPQYEDIAETLVVVAGKTTRIEKTMKRAKGRLSVVTVPSGAQVFLGGKPVGATPLKAFTVPAGEEVRLEFNHPECRHFSLGMTVAKREHKIESIELPLKPASVSVVGVPKRARVFLNEVLLPAQDSFSRMLEPGFHVLRVSQESEPDRVFDVKLRGGERKVISMAALIDQDRTSDAMPGVVGSNSHATVSQVGDERMFLVYGMGPVHLGRLDGRSAQGGLGWGVGVELFLSTRLGVSFEYLNMTRSDGGSFLRSSSWQGFSLGVPYYFWQAPHHQAMVQVRGLVSFQNASQRQLGDELGSPNATTVTQLGVGAEICYRFFFSRGRGVFLGPRAAYNQFFAAASSPGFSTYQATLHWGLSF